MDNDSDTIFLREHIYGEIVKLPDKSYENNIIRKMLENLIFGQTGSAEIATGQSPYSRAGYNRALKFIENRVRMGE